MTPGSNPGTPTKNMDSKKFQRKVEDFICENCKETVKGTGYTNHCPSCLYSKHVDINPGDRLGTCQDLMEPMRVEKKGEDTMIMHVCKRCGYEKRNRVSENDDFEIIVEIAKKETL